MENVLMEEFHLTSELLLQAFWGGYMCNKNCLKRCQGYFNEDVGDFGRGIIEYCVAKNFNIHRVPGYGQYYIKDGGAIRMLHEYGNLREEDIETACQEMMELYQFIQKELIKSKYVIDGKVRLVRSLRPFEMDAVMPQLNNSNNRKIVMPTNIITSYAHDEELFCYGRTMSVVRDVPIEKIIMFDECLYHPPNVCSNNIHGGEYEVWVMEDNVFGKLELDRECFVYRALDSRIEHNNDFIPNYFMPNYAIDSSLYTDENKRIKPCEKNLFTKWLIKRNTQKIRELYGLSKENIDIGKK